MRSILYECLRGEDCGDIDDDEEEEDEEDYCGIFIES